MGAPLPVPLLWPFFLGEFEFCRFLATDFDGTKAMVPRIDLAKGVVVITRGNQT